MKILLDIDDTSLISKDKGKTWNEHPRLIELINSETVYLFSGNPDIDKYAKRWNVKGFYPKGNDFIPKAEILIDNDVDLWIDFVNVKYTFFSIDEFFENYSKLKSLLKEK